MAAAIDDLALIKGATDADEWANRVVDFPLRGACRWSEAGSASWSTGPGQRHLSVTVGPPHHRAIPMRKAA